MNAVAFRILKGINKTYNVSYSKLIDIAKFKSRAEYDQAVNILSENKYITVDELDLTITPKGVKYLQELESNDTKDAMKDLKHSFDFALVGFMNGKPWPIRLEEFPKIIAAKATNIGKYDEGNLHQYLYTCPYVKEDNGSYYLSDTGKFFYETEIEEIENKKLYEGNKSNISFTDNSTHFTGRHIVHAPNSEINNSFNKNEETPEQKDIANKGFLITKKTLFWTILLGLLGTIVSILIAQHVI